MHNNNYRFRAMIYSSRSQILNSRFRLKELCNDGIHVLFDLMQNIPVNLVTGGSSAPLHKTSILGNSDRLLLGALVINALNMSVKTEADMTSIQRPGI